MCMTIEISYLECGHKESYVRPCRDDGSLCGEMVTYPGTRTSDYCCECYMLPDPRVSRPLESRVGESAVEWTARRYLNWNVEDRTVSLQALSQNLPPLPYDRLHYPNFHLSDPVHRDLLSQRSIVMLDVICHQRLMPDFWARVLLGEDPPLDVRMSFLRVRLIPLIQYALHTSRDTLSENEWRIAMGYSVVTHFLPVELPLDNPEDCGICRDPLNEANEHGLPVKTGCNHMFHRECLATWIRESPHGDCPSCRAAIRDGEPLVPLVPLRSIHETRYNHPIPEWLVDLHTPERQVGESLSDLPPFGEIELFEAEVESARLEHMKLQDNFRAIQAELDDVRNELGNLAEHGGERVRQVYLERIMHEAANISEADFQDIQGYIRIYERTIADTETEYQRLRIKRQALEMELDQARTRYHTAARALARRRALAANVQAGVAHNP